jgi:hypothetical protein
MAGRAPPGETDRIYSPLNICSQLPDHQNVIHLLRDYICWEILQEEIISHTKIKVHSPDKTSLPSDAHSCI